MEIKSENINLKESVFCQNINICVEGDVVAPDIKPDIAEVLLADAKVNLLPWDIRGNRLLISGRAVFDILYRSEEEESPIKSIEQGFDFSDTTEIPSAEGLEIYVSAETEHIGFAQVNSRKISVKAVISVKIEGIKNRDIEIVSDVLSEDVQCRKESFNMYMTMGRNSREFSVSDFLTVPKDMPDIEEILKIDAYIPSGERRIMNGKVMVKSSLHVTTLYSSADSGKVFSVKHEIPFTEILEAEGVGEENRVLVNFFVSEAKASAKGDVNGDTKIIAASFTVSARMSWAKPEIVQIINDCYGVSADVDGKKENLSFDRYITSEESEFTRTQSVSLPENANPEEVIYTTVKPLVREIKNEDNALIIRGILVSFVIYRDEKDDGDIRCVVTENDFEWHKNVQGTGYRGECDVWIEEVLTQINGDGIDIKVTVGVNCDILMPETVSAVVSITCGEKSPDTEKHHGIVIYFAGENDTLWEIAKRYETTVERLCTVNGLDENCKKIEKGKRVLVSYN